MAKSTPEQPLEAPQTPVEDVTVEDSAPEVVEPASDVVEEPTYVGFEHVVAGPQDTYASIAEQLGVTPEALYESNLAQPIYPGSIVRIK